MGAQLAANEVGHVDQTLAGALCCPSLAPSRAVCIEGAGCQGSRYVVCRLSMKVACRSKVGRNQCAAAHHGALKDCVGNEGTSWQAYRWLVAWKACIRALPSNNTETSTALCLATPPKTHVCSGHCAASMITNFILSGQVTF